MAVHLTPSQPQLHIPFWPEVHPPVQSPRRLHLHRMSMPLLESGESRIESVKAVFRRIFELLDVPLRESRKDLLNCTKVCRLWYELANPILHRRVSVRICSPPSTPVIVPVLTTHERAAWMQEMHLLLLRNGNPTVTYKTEKEGDYLRNALEGLNSLLRGAKDIRVADLDLIAFTELDVPDHNPEIMTKLLDSNQLLLAIIATLVANTSPPTINLRLELPTRVDKQIETASHLVFDNFVRTAKANLYILHSNCRLPWVVTWLEDLPRLRNFRYFKPPQDVYETPLWDCLPSFKLYQLVLEGFDAPPINKIDPSNLTALVLTQAMDTPGLTNQILLNFPNLLCLFLRNQKHKATTSSVPCRSQRFIVSTKLQNAGWTNSHAPDGMLSILSKTCGDLEYLSLPANTTREDLEAISTLPHLKRLEFRNCLNISVKDVECLKNIEQLQELQFDATSLFLVGACLAADFMKDCSALGTIDVIFQNDHTFDDGDEAKSQDDDHKKDSAFNRILAVVPKEALYISLVHSAMTIRFWDEGAEVRINIRTIREGI